MRNAVVTLSALIGILAAPASLSASTYEISESLAAPAIEQAVNADSSANTAPNTAQRNVVYTETWVEEWDDVTQSWVRVKDSEQFTAPGAAERVYAPAFDVQPEAAVAQFGPFKVLDDGRAAIVGPTDSRSPQFFDMMLSQFPEVGVLEFVEAPGTSDDVANLKVGRMIREAGITTHVPDGGSVRSGAVELFLAGADRTIDDGAEFAVHSWRDNYGFEPRDYAPDSPENRFYLDYYEEMGMPSDHARAFYNMTNSVPHVSALWLEADDMREWTQPMAGESAEEFEFVLLPMPELDAIAAPSLNAGTLAYADLAQLDI